MTLKEVKQLRNGDVVFWKDPDNGLCSKFLKITEIQVHNMDGIPTVFILSSDGSELECFASELS